MLFNIHSKLKHIIFEYPQSIVVLNRFGINLGVGDATINDFFEKKGVNPEFLVAVLNTYLSEHQFSESDKLNYGLKDILFYLRASDNDYIRSILPNVGRHLGSLTSHASEKTNLKLLQRFFEEMNQEVLNAIDYDYSVLFPWIEKSIEIKKNIDIEIDESFVGISEEPEAKLDDLLSFFIVHLTGVENQNLCRAVVDALFTLRKDIKQNNMIRRNILLPMLKYQLRIS